MRNGLMLQGGVNTGTNRNDYCDVRRDIPEWTVLLAQNPTNRWRDTSTGWRTRATALGSYVIPKVEVQVSGTMRSDPGGQLAANWNAPNSATVGLNRPFAGLGSPLITVNLVEPGNALRGTRDPGRHAVREDPEVRPLANDRRTRPLQHDELGCDPECTTRPSFRQPPRGCGRTASCSHGS